MPDETNTIRSRDRGRPRTALHFVESFRKLSPPLNARFRRAILRDDPKREEQMGELVERFLEDPASCAREFSSSHTGKHQKEIAATYAKWCAGYKSWIKKLPALIHANGLGAAVAFIRTKKNKNEAQQAIFDQLTDYYRKPPISMPDQEEDIVGFILKQDSNEWRVLTLETQAFLVWWKRLADAMLEGEEEDA